VQFSLGSLSDLERELVGVGLAAGPDLVVWILEPAVCLEGLVDSCVVHVEAEGAGLPPAHLTLPDGG
jgi:hypothetical protein